MSKCGQLSLYTRIGRSCIVTLVGVVVSCASATILTTSMLIVRLLKLVFSLTPMSIVVSLTRCQIWKHGGCNKNVHQEVHKYAISWSPMEMQTMCMCEKAEAAGLSCNSGSHLMDYQIPLQIVSISVCVR
jgi:hypothetical protein